MDGSTVSMHEAFDAGELLLRLEGFEGPLDMLLDLARNQRVDLKRISILELVDQFLSVIEGAKRIRLELAADWLVMAAWLTWLKSRMLQPRVHGEEDPELAADVLQERLLALQAMRNAAMWLRSRPQLNWDVFGRGRNEDLMAIDRSKLNADLTSLMAAYLSARRRAGGAAKYRPRPMVYLSVQQALERLGRLVTVLPAWSDLEQFLPNDIEPGLPRRAALAATLIAGLEMAKAGQVSIRQEERFGPIQLSTNVQG